MCVKRFFYIIFFILGIDIFNNMGYSGINKDEGFPLQLLCSWKECAMSNTTIPFGVSFRGKPDYTYSEVLNFIECADGLEPLEYRNQYIAFVEDFLDGKIKPSTQVDVEIVREFQADLDNRADIDYREGHWDDEPEIVAGGKYFAKQAEKLKQHIAKHT